MRILHLHGGTSADVDLNLHPQITVVRGLHDPARQWCIDTIGHLAVGRVSTASGEVEASGIRFSLTDKSLSTLGLVVAHSSVVVAADLRPPVSESANGGASGGATTGVHGALAFETGPADTVGMDIAGAQEPEGGGVDLHHRDLPVAVVPQGADALAPSPPVPPPAPPDPVAEAIRQRLSALRQRRLELNRLAESLPGVDTAQVSEALAALRDVPVGTPVAGAEELADRWRDLQREATAIQLATTSDERAAMAEVLAAELAVAEAEAVLRQPQLTDDQIRRIEAAHADYVEASDKVDERRFGAGRARKQLADAEAEEARILARFGFDSWVDYMLNTSKRAADPDMRREKADLEAATKELGHCIADLEAIPGAAVRRRRRQDLSERQDSLSTEVAALLGHQPVGSGVEDELRSLRVDSDRSRETSRLITALDAHSAAPEVDRADVDSVMVAAEQFLDGVANDDRRREELEVAVAAIDVHVDALEVELAADVPRLPDLPDLPDMAEPPVGLLEMVAATDVYFIAQGQALAPGDVAEHADTPATDDSAGDGTGATIAGELARPALPPNPGRSDAGDETKAWGERGARDIFASSGWASDVETPTGSEPVTVSTPFVDSDQDQGSLTTADDEPAVDEPVGGEPVAGGAVAGEPVADGPVEEPDDAVDDELVVGETGNQPVGYVAFDPSDRAALVDDVIWRAMVRIEACRSEGPAGHLPVVLDDPFVDLSDDEAVEVLMRLARLTDLVQLIVLSDRPEVAAWAHDLGRDHALVVG